MNLILYNALYVLESAGEYHGSVSFKNRKVDKVVRLQKDPRKLYGIDVGSESSYGNLDEILVSLDVSCFNALFVSNRLNSADLEAL